MPCKHADGVLALPYTVHITHLQNAEKAQQPLQGCFAKTGLITVFTLLQTEKPLGLDEFIITRRD